LSVVKDGTTFLQSIVWTSLTYNPVRILGLTGLGGLGIAAAILAGLVIARLNGVTELSPGGVAAVFWALVSTVAGVSLFALGATFNYLVSLFYRRPIRQGLFGKPLFRTPVEQHFGWLGLVFLVAGLGLGVVSFVLGQNGWEIARLWLWLTGSALVILTGLQLIIYWLLMRVLDELNNRERLNKSDPLSAFSNN
jgi:hypothetical protein